jgi:hypothetical protein
MLQYADGTGGNGSALRHYEATGRKYPLVVKLGTITPAGADVYSYAGRCLIPQMSIFISIFIFDFYSILFMLNISLLSK